MMQACKPSLHSPALTLNSFNSYSKASIGQDRYLDLDFAKFADLHSIVVISNPNQEDKHFQSVDVNQDVVYVKGRSYLSDVLKDPWGFLGTR